MGSLENIRHHLHGLKPTLLMICVQTIFAVVNIGYKLSANDGMRLTVLVGYRFMFGAAFIVPLAIFVERSNKRPKLTWKIVFYGFLCGLFGGSLGQNLYLKSLALTSATFASAMTNLIPAITFLVAISLRLERLGWNSSAGKAKVVGTIMGIGGAMLLTFYKGPELNLWDTNINLLETTTTHHRQTGGQTPSQPGGHNLALGAVLALASCVCYSLWLIVQAKASEKYPCPYSITAMMTVWGTIQSIGFAACTEKDWSNWALGWNIRLLTVAFAGVLGSGVMFTFVAWCVRMRGPLFVSIFNPLLLVLVAIAGSLLLEEKLHLGMVVGGIVIIMGLYTVLWGKGKELKKMSQLMPENQVSQEHTDVPPPSLELQQSGSGSSNGRGSSRKGAEEIKDNERRNSEASSEVLGGLYIKYP
ncbi:nodulin MtN21 /EamA-like transporter family protein [Striga asiatica]|uniref:WAT1-related protein n=1 Tax=Striga asiatica TaxID=4170 RepID=A0A5A7QPI6_STRAF|nr:nodulin MtN21 /EamA-like transporter family protein [Striga asiatica]